MSVGIARPSTAAGVDSNPSTDEGPAPIDTTVRLITPERIVFAYPLAGPFRRLNAYLFDLGVWCILIVLATIVSQILTFGSRAGTGLIFVAYFVLSWGYGAFFEGLFNGQTPGKRLLGLRVMSDRGVAINGAQAALRNLVGVVDGLVPFFFLPGLASMVLTGRFQRLGDLAAGTMVVVEERRSRLKLVQVKGPEVEQLLPLLPLRVASGPELARAVSDYVRNRGRFAREHREKMAEPLALPLRKRYGLPRNSRADAVLCAFYHRVFHGE